MKLYVIRNEEDATNKDLAYLFYYEAEKRFYIELPDDADEWETPLLLSSFVKRGKKTVNAYWSKLWVQQRIVPTDRQNLGMILRDNGLECYDEFKLLVLADGKCAQDSYYIVKITEKDLPKFLLERHRHQVMNVMPMPANELLVTFRDGSTKKIALCVLVGTDRRFAPVLKNDRIFRMVQVEPGGFGICWGANLCLGYDKLYQAEAVAPAILTKQECCL